MTVSPDYLIVFSLGEGVAFYFGWMTCFTWTLVPIAFVGILLYFFKARGVTVDDNPLLPLYEVLMAFWAISFLTVSVIPHWGLDIIASSQYLACVQ